MLTLWNLTKLDFEEPYKTLTSVKTQQNPTSQKRGTQVEKIKITYEDYENIKPIVEAIKELSAGRVKIKRLKRDLESGQKYDRIYINIT